MAQDMKRWGGGLSGDLQKVSQTHGRGDDRHARVYGGDSLLLAAG